MRGLAKRGTEKAMEMKFGKAGLARGLLEQNPGLVFGSEEVTSATEAAEGVVMEKLRHEEMILPFRQSAVRLTPSGMGLTRWFDPLLPLP